MVGLELHLTQTGSTWILKMTHWRWPSHNLFITYDDFRRRTRAWKILPIWFFQERAVRIWDNILVLEETLLEKENSQKGSFWMFIVRERILHLKLG